VLTVLGDGVARLLVEAGEDPRDDAVRGLRGTAGTGPGNPPVHQQKNHLPGQSGADPQPQGFRNRNVDPDGSEFWGSSAPGGGGGKNRCRWL